ncbi:MAG TPA: hypothetical protein VFB12_28790 [Ktedonobacteraceae bacterium]|nr:hypothetical protein [Ktedonobacteraceae bacterium]
MKHLSRTVWFLFSLTLLLLVLGTPLTSYAATRLPRLPSTPRTCDLRNNAYPTNYAYPTEYSYLPTEYVGSSDPTGPDLLPVFTPRPSPNGGIEAGAWTCGSNYLELIAFPSIDDTLVPDSYRITLTANNVSTFTQVLPSAFYPPTSQGLPTLELTVQAHQVYAIDVAACQNTSCQWAVQLQVVTATNPLCQNGYVWRQIDPDDHVCVQPWERDQAAYDTSQWQFRVDPSNPDNCLPGYVWREYRPFDHVCVDPAQRQQVHDDNSQALSRMVAL